MKDYSGIIQDIKDNITENGKGEITGRDLREILLEAIGNVSVDMGELDRRIEAILGGENYDDIINSWAELEQFLSGLDESSNLVELLSYKADKSDVYSKSDINTKLEDYTKTDDLGALAFKDEVEMSDIKNLEDALDKKLDKEGGEIENNLLVKGELKMGVLFVPTSDGEPSSYRLAIGELGEGADIPSSGEGGLGSVTIMLGDVPYYSDSNGIVRLPAYPTGGGSGVSGDYLPISGGTLSGNNNILTIQGVDNAYIIFKKESIDRASVGYYNNFAYVANETTYARIGIANNGEPQYWPDYTGNTRYTLIHSGNIGSQSVASATKAKILTASDGTSPMIQDNGATIYVGDSVYPSRSLDLLGNVINLRYGASATYGLVLNNAGNVLIGSTTDNGNRLQVQGAISLTTALRMTFNNNSTCGLYPDSWISGADASRLWLYNVGKVAICGEQGVEIHSNLTTYGSISLTNELYCNGWLRSYGDRGWYNETYGGGIYMTDSNFVRTYDNKAFSASYYQMNYTNGVGITSSGNWYRVWEGNYYGSIILSLTHSWSNNQTDNLIFSISTGYEYGASSGITLLSRNIGTNTYQAIRVVYDGDIGKHCVEVFIGPSGPNVHWVSGIGHGVFLQPTLVTSTNLNQRCMMYIDYTATIQSSNNAVINGNIFASGYQLPTSAPSNPVSGGYYLYVGSLGSGAVIS